MTWYTIAPLEPTQVTDYAHAHIELLNTTYAHLADPAYARLRRAEFADRVAELHADLAEADAAETAGRPPWRRHWLATSERGTIVGLACSGAGVGDWEHAVFGTDWTPPATTFCLDHLYVMPGAQGTGLAQALLEVALPQGRDAYLWVISGNERAISFYRRNRFVPDGFAGDTGPSWGQLAMARMVRANAG